MKKILAVDDDVDILTVIEIVLSHYGYIIQVTSDWENISPQIKSFTPDLILLDVSLNGADGREICQALKKNKDTDHIPIVLISAHHNLINNLNGCKPDGIVTKPFDIQYLAETIAKCLN